MFLLIVPLGFEVMDKEGNCLIWLTDCNPFVISLGNKMCIKAKTDAEDVVRKISFQLVFWPDAVVLTYGSERESKITK